MSKTFPGEGFSLNRPDILDLDNEIIWEVKPKSHAGDPGDNGQLGGYLFEMGSKGKCYGKGFPSDLIRGKNVPVGYIRDFVTNDQLKVIAVPGIDQGFIYYDLVNDQSLMDEIFDYAKDFSLDDLPDPDWKLLMVIPAMGWQIITGIGI